MSVVARVARVAPAVLSVVVLAGCSDGYDFTFPDKSRVDVDTPRLRTMKAEAGVEPCEPGATSGVSQLPAVTLPCFGGGPDVDLSTLEGPLVVNIWAGWCSPCRKEMPVLEQFHDRYGDRVAIIGINRNDPQSEAAMELVRETGVTYPLLSDPQDELLGADPFGTLIGLPSFVFVDAEGTASDPVSEPIESLAELVGLVEQHAGVSL